jgi:hypothetical protein
MNNQGLKNLVNIVVFTVLIAFTSQTFATTNVSTRANSQGFGGVGNTTQVDTSAHTSSVAVDLNYLFPDGSGYTGQASASGYADYGVLKVLAYANSGNGSTSFADVTSSFNDTFLINSLGLDGNSGTAIIDLKINYGGAVSGNYNASSYNFKLENSDRNFVFQVLNGISCSPCSTYNSVTSSNQSNIPFSTDYSIAIPFIYGQALTLNLSSYAAAQAWIGGSSAIMDSSHSFYWGGINQILDQNSNIVSGFTVTSASGTNYLQDFSVAAVPEPETYTMMMAGLGLMGFVARRRKIKVAKF